MLQLGNDFSTHYDGEIATLSIKRIYPEDEGEYTCIAENNLGRTYSSACIVVDVPEEKENMISRKLKRPAGLLSSSSAYSTPRSTPRSTPVRSASPYLSYRNIDIDPKRRIAAVAAPKFYTLPQNKVVEEGDNVRFQCVIGGHPQPWSTWDCNGTIVTPTGRVTIMERDDLRILEIEQVTMDDSGLYRITLENDYGRIEATARLDVICQRRRSSRMLRTTSSSPRRAWHWTRRIRGNSTAIGGRLALSSDLRGKSLPPSKKYYHNGEELHDGGRVKIIHESEFVSRVEIENVTKEDEGVYSCVAEFTDGDDPFLMISSTEYIEFKQDCDESGHYLKIRKELCKFEVIDEGCECDLVFEVDCSGDFNYAWFKNGKVVPNSEDFR